jgi:hypothetical protein
VFRGHISALKNRATQEPRGFVARVLSATPSHERSWPALKVAQVVNAREIRDVDRRLIAAFAVGLDALHDR